MLIDISRRFISRYRRTNGTIHRSKYSDDCDGRAVGNTVVNVRGSWKLVALGADVRAWCCLLLHDKRCGAGGLGGGQETLL